MREQSLRDAGRDSDAFGNCGLKRFRSRQSAMPPCSPRNAARNFADAAFGAGLSASVKFTVTLVSTSTGSPLRRYGLYFHCLTASMAAGASMGCPLNSCMFSTSPDLLM